MKKKHFYLVLIFAVLLSFSTYAQDPVEKALLKFINNKDLQHASIGFELRSLEKDSILYAYNNKRSLTPASTMKVITTSTALEMLGPLFKFKTILRYDGYIDSNGVLQGNIYIVGGGDPGLGSRFFSTFYKGFLQKWVTAIKAAGIKKVNGRIIADCSLFGLQSVPNEWIWADIGNYYGSGTYSLSAYDNSFTAYFRTGKAGSSTKIEKVEPSIPYLKLSNHVVSANIRKDESYFYGGPHTHKRVSRGKLPMGRAAYRVKGSIPDPGLFLAYQLDSMLKTNHIAIAQSYKITYTSPKANHFTEIYTTYSPTLKLIIGQTNFFSINLFAEQLFRYIGWYQYKDASYQTCIKAVKEFWESKEIDTKGLFMYDGCGLSPHDAVSPAFYCDVLNYMYNKSPYKNAFLHSLPVSCKSGSLVGFCTGSIACGRIKAKSGSIDKVKTYTGYIRNLKGDLFAFAILINYYNGSSREVKNQLKPLMSAIVRYAGMK